MPESKQESLFPVEYPTPEEPLSRVDLSEFARSIGQNAIDRGPRLPFDEREDVYADVTGVKPGAGDVTVHGPGSPDWDAMRSRVG